MKGRLRIHCLLASALIPFTALISFSFVASAQEPSAISPGEVVVTKLDHVQFGIRDQDMLTIPLGSEIHVTEIRGKWIGGYTVVDGTKHLGWLRESEIESRRAKPRPRPQIPDVPDRAEDVEAWKKLGVDLHFDESGRIQQIKAERAPVADADLVHLQGAPHLLSLDLTGQPITDEGAKHIAKCVGLQKLYLGQTQVSDSALQYLSSLTQLEVLSAPQTAISGQGLKGLSNMYELRVLNLEKCNITDDDLQSIAMARSIEVLTLPHTKVSDAGLKHLRGLSKLRVLNLNGTDVTGTGFDHLLGLTELRMLYVRQCMVDISAVDMLDDKLPGLAVYD